MRRGRSCTLVRAGGSFVLTACRGYWRIGGRFDRRRNKSTSSNMTENSTRVMRRTSCNSLRGIPRPAREPRSKLMLAFRSMSARPLQQRRWITAWLRPMNGRRFGCALASCDLFAPSLKTTLGYAEKVRSQFLSLRQLAEGSAFSRRSSGQLSPITVAISRFSFGLSMG